MEFNCYLNIGFHVLISLNSKHMNLLKGFKEVAEKVLLFPCIKLQWYTLISRPYVSATVISFPVQLTEFLMSYEVATIISPIFEIGKPSF